MVDISSEAVKALNDKFDGLYIRPEFEQALDMLTALSAERDALKLKVERLIVAADYLAGFFEPEDFDDTLTNALSQLRTAIDEARE